MTNKKKYILIALLICGALLLAGCSASTNTAEIPIQGPFKFEDVFVYPMAGLMWLVAKTIGFGNYGLAIIISTLVVRTLAWPIYAKTNDMSLKMQLVGPEAEKIKQKYAGKDDKQSQQRMQIETMQLYKKYGIGLGGCLMPIIQLPIFIGFYRTILRMPVTLKNLPNSWLQVFKYTNFLGVDLLKGQTESPYQKWAVITLAVLVGITQIISLLISQRRQKKVQRDQQSEVPAYRRTQQDQTQRQTAMTMNFMMYFMTGMMVLFVLQSPAGLGLYWLVGNIYSTLQSYIGHVNSEKRLEYLKSKH